MKIKFLLPVLVVAVGCRASDNKESYGTASPAPGTVSPEAGYAAPGTTMSAAEPIAVEVVSIDLATNRITVRAVMVPPPEGVARAGQRSPDQKSLSVDPALNETVRNLKAGEAISITCTERPLPAGTSGTRSGAPITTVTECEHVTMITPSAGGGSGTMRTSPRSPGTY